MFVNISNKRLKYGTKETFQAIDMTGLFQSFLYLAPNFIQVDEMPSNVEIKAKVKDFETFKNKAREISASEGEVIEQKDIFFNVPHGRLKLRFLQNKPSQLIAYERDDKAGPKISEYHVATTDEPDELANVLMRALGEKGIVKKKRLLYLVGQTRVHCDEVEGLGCFMELEVVMKENQSAKEGEQIARDLMSKLGVEEDDLINGAYIDMICSQNELKIQTE